MSQYIPNIPTDCLAKKVVLITGMSNLSPNFSTVILSRLKQAVPMALVPA